jgi:hypothetical protein
VETGTKRLVIVIGVLGALGAAAFGATKVVRASQDRAADEARASLRRCVLGAELAPGERASERVERVFLGTMGLGPGALEAANATDWPSRCDVYAEQIARWQLERGDGAAQADSTVLATALRTRDFAGALRNHETPTKLDFAWAMAPSTRAAPASVPMAPPPLIVADDRAAVFAPGLRLYRLAEDKLSSRELRLVVQREGSARPLFCRFAGELRGARCSEVPAAVGQWPEPSPHTEDGGPDLVSESGSSGSRFFRMSDGRAFGAGTTAVQGAGRKGDSVWVLQPGGEPKHALTLERWTGTALVDSTPVPLPDGVSWNEVRFVGDRLAWWSPTTDGTRRLVLRRVSDAGPALGPEEELVTLPPGKVDVSACRTDTALVIDASEGPNHTLSFRETQGGPLPVKVDVPDGARLSCDRESASLIALTTLSARHTVHDARCTRVACRTSRIEVEDFARGDVTPEGDASVAAAPIGDSLLVVWKSAKGGIRMRVAPAEKLGAAKDVVLFDDWLHEGKPSAQSVIHEVRVVARRDAAIVLLGGSSGVWAFRVDAEGKASGVVGGT